MIDNVKRIDRSDTARGAQAVRRGAVQAETLAVCGAGSKVVRDAVSVSWPEGRQATGTRCGEVYRFERSARLLIGVTERRLTPIARCKMAYRDPAHKSSPAMGSSVNVLCASDLCVFWRLTKWQNQMLQN